MGGHLFPFSEYWWFYPAFSLAILIALVFELGLFSKKHKEELSIAAAALRTCIWVALALVFCLGLFIYTQGVHGTAIGIDASLEFLTGYLIEESLSVDNLFVFLILFRYFSVPLPLQRVVLFWGIIGALLFRGLFITLGAFAFQYEMVFYAFGLSLVYTGAKIPFESEKPVAPENNIAIKLLRRCFPVSKDYHGERFFINANGTIHATPLFVALLGIELSDILFAMDSVPAVFAITREPLIVFTSNVFAILGLRSLYFLLAGAFDRFYLLKYGLSFVLIFVGLKMTLLKYLFDDGIPNYISLLIILSALSVSILLSLFIPNKQGNKI